MSEHFPKGYQIHVNTWENDLDSCKTKILSGLTADDVEFYVDLLKNFQSRNHVIYKDHAALGNGEADSAELLRIVNETIAQHPDISETERLRWTDDVGEDYVYEVLMETLLDDPDNQYYAGLENFCRVFDDLEVYYFPSVVENVTDKFWK